MSKNSNPDERVPEDWREHYRVWANSWWPPLDEPTEDER